MTTKHASGTKKDHLRFLWLHDAKGHPLTCIAFMLTDEGIVFGTATCHPRDMKKFNKARGRLIATGRLSESPTLLPCNAKDPSVGDIMQDIMLYIAGTHPTVMNDPKHDKFLLATVLAAEERLKSFVP